METDSRKARRKSHLTQAGALLGEFKDWGNCAWWKDSPDLPKTTIASEAIGTGRPESVGWQTIELSFYIHDEDISEYIENKLPVTQTSALTERTVVPLLWKHTAHWRGN